MNFQTVQRQYQSINRTVGSLGYISATKKGRINKEPSDRAGMQLKPKQNKCTPLQPPKSSKALMSAQYILFRPFSPNSLPASCQEEIRADG